MLRAAILALGLSWAGVAVAEPDAALAALIGAATSQVGVTTGYDPAYVRLDFPMGDVPRETGVCTDVLIRALRDAWGADLQALVNADMKADFAAYPANWGLTSTDRNIDHRRVPNLQAFLARKGAEVAVTSDPAEYLPGDVVSWMLPGNLPHIGLVTDQPGASGAFMVIHNIGRGAQVEDRLFDFPITGHYRLTPEVRKNLGLAPVEAEG